MSWKKWGESKTFKVMLFPEAAPEVRGAYNFKKARGRGYLRLKCEDDLGSKSHFVTMRMSMGEESRGPVKHDFAQSVCLGDNKNVFFLFFCGADLLSFLKNI